MVSQPHSNYIDIIIPVYNEEEILPEFHRRITALNLPLNLLYIDNCSTDRSVEIITSFSGAKLLRHDRNEGYGGSILDGFAHSDNEKIIIIDADCEYPPEILPELINKLDAADVVYTSRFLEGRNQFMPFTKRLGNQLLTTFFNLLFGQNLTDLYTGCKGLKRSTLSGITLRRQGFEHVLELAVKLAKRKIIMQEVAIDFSPRSTGEAKMKHLSETLKYLYLIVFYSLTER